MSLLAASVARNVALGVVLALTVGWIVYLLSSSRRTYDPGGETVYAPNRKRYYEDEQLEGPRLTKYLWWAFAMLTISAVGLPLYWLREPFRQQGAGFDRGVQYFEDLEVKRGKELYEIFPGDPPTPREPHFGCESCHGPEGVGGVAQYTLVSAEDPDAPPRQVQWIAPALDTVMLRYRPEEVRNILVYGRPGTPMPAWGLEGGGPMNDQQIDDLIAYMTHIARDPDEVRQESLEQYGIDGEAVFEGFCARCHTEGAAYGEPGVPGGGALGPSLIAGATVRQFPTVDSHVDWVAQTVPYGQLYGTRGISEGVMPFFENMLTPEQIRAVVEYERGL